ncbi:glycoside hydrolase family 18 protein [Singulisphaera sp. PoT]|uniref:glycoside hydrolase family 18 protein n=1 Tax=Singulisphaera sp. PoT TaxID=3411797 RepID=UPI003BF6085D
MPTRTRHRIRPAPALLAALSCALLAVGGTLKADEDAKPEGKVFVGYAYGPSKDLDYKLYTHLCQAFLTADAEGHVRKGRNIPNTKLTSNAHKAGVKVLISLGGWGWDKQFASIVSKPEAEDRYLKSVMEIVKEGDYDGVDIDWEYPDTKEEVVGFERLTRRFRKDLDTLGTEKKRHMLITMAASSNPGTLKWLNKSFLLETMDWVNVMTYDFTGDWTNYAGHHSPLFSSSKQPGNHRPSTERSMKYLIEEQGIPASRLAVGIPLYGRGFGVKEPYASTKDAPKTRMPEGNYSKLHQLLEKEGWTRTWDDETKNPWLLAPDHKSVIGYDDVESVTIKTDWSMKQGFRGVFFWQVNSDAMPGGSHPLQEASHKAWEASQSPGK